MNTRWIKLVALVLALLLPLASVGAQSMKDSAVICGDLPEADCQILKDSDAVMDGVTSFAFDMSMLMDVDAVGDSMSLSMDASGYMSISSDVLEAAMHLESEHMKSGSEMMSDEAVVLLDTLIAGMSAEMNAALQIAAQGESSDMNLHLLIKDGIVAINATAIAEATGESMEGLEWFGVDANGLFSLLASEAGAQESMMSDMAEQEDMVSAVSVTRLADSEVNGIPVAVFESVLDAGALFALLDMEATDSIISSSGALTASMWQYIGLSDSLVHRAEFTLTTADDTMGTSTDMALDINMSEFNAPFSVEIPEDAFIFPLEFLMQMGS